MTAHLSTLPTCIHMYPYMYPHVSTCIHITQTHTYPHLSTLSTSVRRFVAKLASWLRAPRIPPTPNKYNTRKHQTPGGMKHLNNHWTVLVSQWMGRLLQHQIVCHRNCDRFNWHLCWAASGWSGGSGGTIWWLLWARSLYCQCCTSEPSTEHVPGCHCRCAAHLLQYVWL